MSQIKQILVSMEFIPFPLNYTEHQNVRKTAAIV